MNSSRQKAKNKSGFALKSGFTLIEMLLVMLIMSILAVAVSMIYRNVLDGTKKHALFSNLRALAGAAQLYASTYEHTPTSIGDLIPLLETSLTDNPKGSTYTLDASNYIVKGYFTLRDGSLYLTQKEY
jgi:prepilin-type N-terminal cleavage/methylation domain-containing protein